MPTVTIITQRGDDFVFEVDQEKIDEIGRQMRWGGNLQFRDKDGLYKFPYHALDHIFIED